MAEPPSIALRPFRQRDAAFFADLAADPRVTRFVGNGLPWERHYTASRIEEALQEVPVDRVGSCRWFMALQDGDPAGVVVAMHREAGIEIGYWVHPGRWGRGLGGAMLDAALVLVPETFGTGDLFARVDPANTASARLLSDRGFDFDGHHAGVDHYRLLS